MKKQILIFASLLSSVFISNAQISNSGLETWGSRTNTIGVPPFIPSETFNYTDPTNWSTSNQATVHSMLGNGSYVTQDTSNFYEGTSSARIESNEISILGNTVTIPGLLVSGEFVINPLDFATGNINPFAVPGVGFPVTGKPSKLVGYFKYAPAGVDTCEIACALVDSARNQVAFGIFRNAATVGAFTRFEVDLFYISCNRPDTICIIGSSSPFTSGAATAGVDGSTLWIDSLGISYTPVPNVFPLANNDTVTTYKNHPLTISTLLSNDNDCDGGTLSITSTTTPLHGTNTNTATSVTYTPNNNFVGNDVFNYNISDGSTGLATAFVVVKVLDNVGIEDYTNSSIQVYPNPATNNIMIDGIGANTNYTINDLSGKIILKGTTNNHANIDITALSNGTYVLNINGAAKKINVNK
jgi:hypothetical protein